MTLPAYFNSKKSLNLFGLEKNFLFLKNLWDNNTLPKVLMLSGKKGSGKSTLFNHLMFYIFDSENYNLKNNKLRTQSIFYNQFLNNIFSNIIYLSGSDFKNVKIEDIRNLKKKIYQTSISNKPRFIIFDDIELFNINSSNALLKIIEEPAKNNYFVLINNKSKPIIETIYSRCLDIKILLNEENRISVINSLIDKFGIEKTIDVQKTKLTPGNFIIFNYFFKENQIIPDRDYLKNLTIILNLYKKNKEVLYIDMLLFLTDYYFNELKEKGALTKEKTIDYKIFVFENINKFFLYNLNQNALLTTINSKIYD
jgi:DNA polymerase III subunit delta'